MTAFLTKVFSSVERQLSNCLPGGKFVGVSAARTRLMRAVRAKETSRLKGDCEQLWLVQAYAAGWFDHEVFWEVLIFCFPIDRSLSLWMGVFGMAATLAATFQRAIQDSGKRRLGAIKSATNFIHPSSEDAAIVY